MRKLCQPPNLRPFFAILRACGTVAMALLLSACWLSEVEVITMDMAEEVPGLDGVYEMDDGTNTVARVPFSNDYRVHSVDFDGAVFTGTFRALHLRSNIYVVQLKFDGDEAYSLLFYRFTGGPEPAIVQMTAAAEVDDMAAEHGVTLDVDESGLFGSLAGEPEAILNFLLGHRSVPLEPA